MLMDLIIIWSKKNNWDMFEDIGARCVGKIKANVFDRFLILQVKRSLLDDHCLD